MKRFLEVLRGKPIAERSRSVDVPCIETSDSTRLCKHPVVSVHMITYNHEPYIRQAIEGVMMQQTDFEFELVIGEDCSRDKTREICFEYQRKHPDKIRVLWWHENVSKLGGNDVRVTLHCRGDFIAFCEGDDYWIDPLKLQKQVDAMRDNPNVAFCFCNAIFRYDKIGVERLWDAKKEVKEGVINGDEFFRTHVFGPTLNVRENPLSFLMTATMMIRKSTRDEAFKRFSIFNWQLALGDSTMWLGLSMLGDAFYVDSVVSEYRQLSTGACASSNQQVGIDSQLVRVWFAKERYGIDFADFPSFMLENFLAMRYAQLRNCAFDGARKYLKCIWNCKDARRALFRFRTFPFIMAIMARAKSHFVAKCLNAWVWRMPRIRYSKALRRIYG